MLSKTLAYTKTRLYLKINTFVIRLKKKKQISNTPFRFTSIPYIVWCKRVLLLIFKYFIDRYIF